MADNGDLTPSDVEELRQTIAQGLDSDPFAEKWEHEGADAALRALCDHVSRLTAALDAARADTTDAERLNWLERNSARVHVVDPPSGDARVWVVVATDDDNAPCEPEGQGDTLREAIDNAMTAARTQPEGSND